jgi:hypothetical protein
MEFQMRNLLASGLISRIRFAFMVMVVAIAGAVAVVAVGRLRPRPAFRLAPAVRRQAAALAARPPRVLRLH